MLKRIRRRLRRKPVAQPPSVILDNQLLAGKNVLITGAGRNIGRSIALEMAQQGANIFFTEIRTDYRDRLQQELASLPIRSTGYLCDGSKQDEIDQLCCSLDEQQIQIDVLVNNAGVQIEKSAVSTWLRASVCVAVTISNSGGLFSILSVLSSMGGV